MAVKKAEEAQEKPQQTIRIIIIQWEKSIANRKTRKGKRVERKKRSSNNTSSTIDNKILNRFVEAVATIMYNINIIIQWYVLHSAQSVYMFVCALLL